MSADPISYNAQRLPMSWEHDFLRPAKRSSDSCAEVLEGGQLDWPAWMQRSLVAKTCKTFWCLPAPRLD